MGSQYDWLVIGTNGAVSFDVTYANTTCPYSIPAGDSLPSATYPLLSIFCPFQDMRTDSSGAIYIDTIGTAPSRAFVISFYRVPYYSCTDTNLTSQVVLYETTNVIDIYIQQKPVCSSQNGGRGIEGIQRDTTTEFSVPGRNNGVWSAMNDAWRFTPNALPNIVRIAWYEGTSVIGVGDSIRVCPLTTTTYVATASYTPCGAGSPTVFSDTITVHSSYIGIQQSSPQNATCYGSLDGYASVNVSGGSPPYTYSWSPNSSTTNTASNLAAGTYTVFVSDTTSCYNTAYIAITQPPLLTLTDSSVATTCSSCNDGLIILSAVGGIPSYTFSISPAVGTHIGGFFYNLPAGNYSTCVADANGCSTCDSITVDMTTGIQSSAESSLSISFYPNPFNIGTVLNINSYREEKMELQITDAIGRTVCTKQVDNGKNFITRENIPSGGIYFYSVISNQEILAKGKLIVID
jgi:hypothetical protein